MNPLGFCVVNAPDGEGGIRAGGLGQTVDDPALTLEASQELKDLLTGQDLIIPWQLKNLGEVPFVSNTHPDLEYFRTKRKEGIV